jgi:hypothetical protein
MPPLPTTPPLSLTQASTPFTTSLRRLSNRHRRQDQKRQAKILTVLDPQGFEVVQHRRICTILLTNPILRI